MELSDYFYAHPKAALAFSGGVDSAYLLYEAVRNGADVRPYFLKTAFQPAFELSDAQRFADALGVRLTVVERDILRCREVAENPPDRCYHCKKALFGTLREQSLKDGYALLTDGTNASDDADDRPGMRALRELDVASPLRECGLTKDEIRRRSASAGLFTASKPAYACLATRIPTGTPLTSDALRRVENAESALFRLGFTDFRVRVFHNAARIQLPSGQWDAAPSQRADILAALKPYFEIVLLDLETR